MRPIAINLPQFHEMEINNAWWGKGFTEWSHVKQATPLFVGHKQPLHPLNGNYYDMTELGTLKQQTEWMKRAGIYGMAYYHYWYEDQPLMFRPIELLRDHPEIDQKYMLYWSNCDWFYSVPTDYQRKLMLHQEYGGPENWETHICYLLRFFADQRYIQIDGKPVLCIYRPGELPHYDEMIALFRRRCEEAGMKGLYVIETMFNYGEVLYHDCSDAVLYREPNCCKKICCKKKLDGTNRGANVFRDGIPLRVDTYQYEEAVRVSVREQSRIVTTKKHYHGIFTGWDNTPRHGYKGYVFLNSSPELLKQYAEGLVAHIEDSNDFLFLNAWNEWAEGMYLEPTEEYGYRNLDAIAAALSGEPTPLSISEKSNYFEALIERLMSSKALLLYGAGRYGAEFLSMLRTHIGISRQRPPLIFIDDTPEKQKTIWCNVPVVSVPEGLEQHPDALIVLCADERSHPTLLKKLAKIGVSKERIVIPEVAFWNPSADPAFIRQHEKALSHVSSILEDQRSQEILQAVLRYRMYHETAMLRACADPIEQRYFDPSAITCVPDGLFLDCGSFQGDTVKAYITAMREHRSKIICCEPNPDNFKTLCHAVEQLGIHDAVLHQKAVWSDTGMMPFLTVSERSGTISSNGNISVETDTIDHIIGKEKIGFLKIEVNGAEYEALLGSIGVIRRDHPLIAVSIYHNSEDLIRIPILLKCLNPAYRLFLRYYGLQTLTDIVCYAVPKMEATK